MLSRYPCTTLGRLAYYVCFMCMSFCDIRVKRTCGAMISAIASTLLLGFSTYLRRPSCQGNAIFLQKPRYPGVSTSAFVVSLCRAPNRGTLLRSRSIALKFETAAGRNLDDE